MVKEDTAADDKEKDNEEIHLEKTRENNEKDI